MAVKSAQTKSPIIKNLTGGLNVREAITDIADNEACAASNVNFYTAGSVARRGGWQKLIANSPTSLPLTGAFQANFVINNVITYFLIVTDGTLGVWQTSNPTANPVVWTKIDGGLPLDASQPWQFVQMANYVIAYNGVAQPWSWQGTGNIASLAAAPVSNFAIVWQNYLWWLGIFGQPQRAQYSDLGDPTTYPSANFQDVPSPYDGDPIMGGDILYGNLIIFKRFSIYIVQGTPVNNLIQSKLNSSVGCISPRGIKQVDNLIYFISDKGLYEANLFNVRQSCYKVEPRYLAAALVNSLANPIWLQHYKQRGQLFISVNCQSLYLSAPTAKNDRIICHDYFNADANGDPAVSEHIVGYTDYGLRASKPNQWSGPSIMGDYYYAGVPNSKVTVMASFGDQWLYVMTEGNFALGGPQDQIAWLGAQYPQTDYQTKFFDMGDPDMMKVMRWIWATGEPYNSLPIQAGIVYSNDPTVASFANFSTEPVLASPNGTVYEVTADDDGAIDIIPQPGATAGVPLFLAAPNGTVYSFALNNDGSFSTSLAPAGSTASMPLILTAPSGYTYILGVGNDGAPTTTLALTPTLFTIICGTRNFIPAQVFGQGLVAMGKYIQLYFQNVGILSQFSMDLILKGRRN